MKLVYELTTQEVANILAAHLIREKKANLKDKINYQLSIKDSVATYKLTITKAKKI